MRLEEGKRGVKQSKALRGNYSKIVSYEKTFLFRGLSANTSLTNLKVHFQNSFFKAFDILFLFTVE